MVVVDRTDMSDRLDQVHVLSLMHFSIFTNIVEHLINSSVIDGLAVFSNE